MSISEDELMRGYESRELYFFAILVYYKDYQTCRLICDFFGTEVMEKFPLCWELCELQRLFEAGNWDILESTMTTFRTKFMISAKDFIIKEVFLRKLAYHWRDKDITPEYIEQLQLNGQSDIARTVSQLIGYPFEVCDIGNNEFFSHICQNLHLDTIKFIAKYLSFARKYQQLCVSGVVPKESPVQSENFKSLPEVKSQVYLGMCKYLRSEINSTFPDSRFSIFLTILSKNIEALGEVMSKDDIDNLASIIEDCLLIDSTETVKYLRGSPLSRELSRYFSILPLAAKLCPNEQYFEAFERWKNYLESFDKKSPPRSLLELGECSERLIESRSLIASNECLKKGINKPLFRRCYVLEGEDEIWALAAGPRYFLVGRYAENGLELYHICKDGEPRKAATTNALGFVRKIANAGNDRFIVTTTKEVYMVTVTYEVPLDNPKSHQSYKTEAGSHPRASQDWNPNTTIHKLFSGSNSIEPSFTKLNMHVPGSLRQQFKKQKKQINKNSRKRKPSLFSVENETNLEEGDIDQQEDDVGAHIDENRPSTSYEPQGSTVVEFGGLLSHIRSSTERKKYRRQKLRRPAEKAEEHSVSLNLIPRVTLEAKIFEPDWDIDLEGRFTDAFWVAESDNAKGCLVGLFHTGSKDETSSKEQYYLIYKDRSNKLVLHGLGSEPACVAFSERDIIVLPIKTVHAHQSLSLFNGDAGTFEKFELPHLPEQYMQYNMVKASKWDPRVIVLLSPPNRILIMDKRGERPTYCFVGPQFESHIMDLELLGPFDRFIVVTSEDADFKVYVYDRLRPGECYVFNDHELMMNAIAAYLPYDENASEGEPYLVMGGDESLIYYYCDPI